MELASTDRRAVRTRTALRAALAAEIEATGDLTRVTVTAVADRAGITRRTFYSHFRDIPDLVESIEDETIEGVRPYVQTLAQVHLPELEAAIDAAESCPGSVELLRFLEERTWLRPLLGEKGDPTFRARLEEMVYDVVVSRALDGIDVRAIGAFFDYYLAFTISAEVGVVVRWLAGGARESASAMARLMTALMFVRPGDLYGNPIDLDIPRFVLAAIASEEDHHD